MATLELEERVARLEGRIDEHSKFFESLSVKLTLLDDKGDRNREEIEKKIETVRQGLGSLRQELGQEISSVRHEIERKIDSVRRDMDMNFRWIVGIQITTWITILLTILFK